MTVYPQTEQPIRTPDAQALYVFDTGNGLARWRLRKYHGPVTRGSVSTAGWGDIMVFATPADAEAFRAKHPRHLAASLLTTITQSELLRRNAHTVIAIPAWYEVRTSCVGEFLALTPGEQSGLLGRLLRWR